MNTERSGEATANGKSYKRMIKRLQIAAVIFMTAMVVLCFVLLNKYNISVSNADKLAQSIEGGIYTLAAGMILFSIVKSLALVFTPSILYVLSGIIFEDVWFAIGVNFVATFVSLFIPYYLGRFTGRDMLTTLTQRFPKIKKLDDFADANDFAVVTVFKAAGVLPSDLSGLIIGALNIPLGKYLLGSTIGTLPINIMWTILGNKGDIKNPKTVLYLLPIVAFAVLMSVGLNLYKKRKEKKNTLNEQDSVTAD